MTGTHEERLLIGGKLVPAESGATYPNYNPATEELIGHVADAGPADIEAAIVAARQAFDETEWSTNKEMRKQGLRELHEALVREREELRAELVAEVGTPVMITYTAQLDAPVDDMPWFIDSIDEFEWERDLGVHESFGAESRRVVKKEAIGVVAAIVPWNYPIEVTLNKLSPALAAGNTVIIKAAPDTPFNATRIGRLVAEHTSIPAGVVNVITSSDKAIGELLVTDPRVDMISFTGSTATGRRIMEAAAPTLKRLFLELGGKSAHILLDDADFEAIVPTAAAFMCSHAGQGCVLNTRLLVPRARYDEAVNIAKATFDSVGFGDPTDPNTLCGPVINKSQYDKILNYIEIGKQEGARVVSGGGAGEFDKGYFVKPTLFADATNNMRIAREEIFGPVLVVIPYDTEEEAIAIANDSEYGLGAGVSSSDITHASKVADRLRSGTVGINNASWYGPQSPFGGYKSSGIGRQNGVEGMNQYTETKVVGLPV
jgi:aldehyde dehydrogenase (NAD+)